MANLYISSIGFNISVSFPAYVTSFSDSFKASYTEDALPYNVDPHRAYSNTTRNISISFDIVSENKKQSIENLQKVSNLSSFVFAVKNSNGTITKPPILKIFYFNLLRDPYMDGSNPINDGLTCRLLSFDIKPEFESGFFTDSTSQAIFPKLIKLSMQIAPYHIIDPRPEVQFGINGVIINGNYPYFIKKGNIISNLAQSNVTSNDLASSPVQASLNAAKQIAVDTGQGTSLTYTPASPTQPTSTQPTTPETIAQDAASAGGQENGN